MANLTVLSLGMGKQSSYLALNEEQWGGVDCAIWADTGAESLATYMHAAKLQPYLPFPVYTVQHRQGLLVEETNNLKRTTLPYFTAPSGMLRRQCTQEYKIKPIERKIRELLGLKKGQRVPKGTQVEIWQGISLDEMQRARTSPDKWQTWRYPLLESRISRLDCIEWLTAEGWDVPRSSCVMCPFHSDEEWQRVKDSPDWEQVVLWDRHIRTLGETPRYLHRDRKPIDEIEFNADKDQIDLFDNECTGMCGL